MCLQGFFHVHMCIANSESSRIRRQCRLTRGYCDKNGCSRRSSAADYVTQQGQSDTRGSDNPLEHWCQVHYTNKLAEVWQANCDLRLLVATSTSENNGILSFNKAKEWTSRQVKKSKIKKEQKGYLICFCFFLSTSKEHLNLSLILLVLKKKKRHVWDFLKEEKSNWKWCVLFLGLSREFQIRLKLNTIF